MNYNKIKLIDFSQGIKASEVMYNDNALQAQIERERLSVSGYGVSYGLEITLNEFELEVTSGTIIDTSGAEISVTGIKTKIEYPNLIPKRQRLNSTNNGEIVLNEVPYALTRTEPSEFTKLKSNIGIEAYYENSQGNLLGISSVSGKMIYTNGNDAKRSIIVNYNVAYDRIDTVYIDKNHQIKLSAGVDSLTPSAYIPEDCKYVLGFIRINSSYYDSVLRHPIAKTILLKEMNNRRNLYTDSENNLFLCGVPFESLLKIYFEEPLNPKEGMLWYDMETNKLKIWRKTDNFIFSDIITYTSSDPLNFQLFRTSVGYLKNQLSVYIESRMTDGTDLWVRYGDSSLEYYTDLKESEKGKIESKQFRIIPKLSAGSKIRYAINKYEESHYWVPINDTSFVPALETTMWAPSEDGEDLVIYMPGLNLDEMELERPNHDLKTFLFKSENINQRFTPYKNELSILIDQIPLYRDQFVEITLEDIIADPNGLGKLATDYYGYTSEYLEDMRNQFENIGLGFRLTNALDRPGFIEVNITHRVNDSTAKNKLQRSATFAKTETIEYKANGSFPTHENKVKISTLIPYRYAEHQLEVYCSGRRIDDVDIVEISDNNIRGSMCNSFAIDSSLITANASGKMMITYKITTNVYAYDHITSIIEEANEKFEKKLTILEEEVEELKRQIQQILQ